MFDTPPPSPAPGVANALPGSVLRPQASPSTWGFSINVTLAPFDDPSACDRLSPVPRWTGSGWWRMEAERRCGHSPVRSCPRASPRIARTARTPKIRMIGGHGPRPTKGMHGNWSQLLTRCGAAVTVWAPGFAEAGGREVVRALAGLGYRVKLRLIASGDEYFSRWPRLPFRLDPDRLRRLAVGPPGPVGVHAALVLVHRRRATNTSHFCDPAIERQMRRALVIQRRSAAANAAWAAVDRTIGGSSPWLAYGYPTAVYFVSERVGNVQIVLQLAPAYSISSGSPDRSARDGREQRHLVSFGDRRGARARVRRSPRTRTPRPPRRSVLRTGGTARRPRRRRSCRGFGLGGVGRLAQRGEQPHSDHDTSNVSWITRARRCPNAGVKPSSAWPNPSPSSSRFGSPAAATVGARDRVGTDGRRSRARSRGVGAIFPTTSSRDSGSSESSGSRHAQGPRAARPARGPMRASSWRRALCSAPPRQSQYASEEIPTTASTPPTFPAWRSTAMPPCDVPTVTTVACPSRRASATTASTSWISAPPKSIRRPSLRAPHVERVHREPLREVLGEHRELRLGVPAHEPGTRTTAGRSGSLSPRREPTINTSSEVRTPNTWAGTRQ